MMAIFFLANFMTDIFKTDWTGQEYISFILLMLFWLGVSFRYWFYAIITLGGVV